MINAQDFSALWTDYFSFFEIVDITKSDSKIYAASENVIFSYDVNTTEIEKITTIQGLSGDLISTIEYSESEQLLLIGYQNGLIEIYFETDQSVLTVVDIIDKESIDPSIKTINDFYEFEGLVYVSTNFGISVYDVERLEFGDTYFIGTGNTQIPVEKTTVFNGFIYAACNGGNGVKKGLLTNPDLIDANQWQTITNGSYFSIENIDGNLYALNADRNLFQIVNDTPNFVFNFPILPNDSDVSSNTLIYTTSDEVFILSASAILLNQIGEFPDTVTDYNSALSFGDDIYIATSSRGVIRTNTNDLSQFIEIRPNGPLRNDSFRIQAFNSGLWVTYGEYGINLNPFPLSSRGISILLEDEWNNKPFDSLLGMRDLNDIEINPDSPNQVFISSFVDGILELNNFEATNFFDETNSPLESLILPGNPNFVNIRTGAMEFDNNGNLWNGKLSVLIFTIVQMKLIAPKIEAAPDKCKLKIARSTAPPE